MRENECVTNLPLLTQKLLKLIFLNLIIKDQKMNDLLKNVETLLNKNSVSGLDDIDGLQKIHDMVQRQRFK